GKGLGLVQKGESSSSTETDGSSPEYHYNISETESKGLRKVFKRFSGRLCYLMKEPVELATHLQIKNLIQYSVMIELLTSPESEQAKAITLVRDLHKQMKSHPAKLFSIVEVFLQNAALKEPGKEMLQEIGKICPEMTAFVVGEQFPSDSLVEFPRKGSQTNIHTVVSGTPLPCKPSGTCSLRQSISTEISSLPRGICSI
ncbi:hypothetical protein GBAR_LOCUS18483, partial [Geodia barretti]